MKINFNQTLKKLDGSPIPRIERKACPQCGFRFAEDFILEKETTLKYIVLEALQMIFNDEQGLSGEEKVKRWLLAVRIEATSEIDLDLTVEEIALIKRLVGKAYGPLIVGQTWEMLEGKSLQR